MLEIGRWKFMKDRGIPIDSKSFAKSDTALRNYITDDMMVDYLKIFHGNDKRSSKRGKQPVVVSSRLVLALLLLLYIILNCVL